MENEIIAKGPSNLIYLFTLGALTVAMLWESMLPRRELQQGLIWRWSNNFALSLLTRYITVTISISFVLALSRWTQIREVGLFQQVAAPSAVMFLVLLLVSQLISYLMHIAFHRISWLWPLHAVHHSDVDVDVSTSYRHHPLEPLVSLPLAAPAILLLGVPEPVVLAFKLFEIGATLFSHSNVRIPQGVEKYLRFILLTPDFHRLHHCVDKRFTNSNYGSLVPWFDYLFGTASNRPYGEQESMDLGLEYLREPGDGRLDRLLWEPVRVRALLRSEHSQPPRIDPGNKG